MNPTNEMPAKVRTALSFALLEFNKSIMKVSIELREQKEFSSAIEQVFKKYENKVYSICHDPDNK